MRYWVALWGETRSGIKGQETKICICHKIKPSDKSAHQWDETQNSFTRERLLVLGLWPSSSGSKPLPWKLEADQIPVEIEIFHRLEELV